MLDLKTVIEQALHRKVISLVPVRGGDISSAWRVSIAEGQRVRCDVFVKSHHEAPPGMFAAEARGLGFLAEAKALRTPEVLAVGDAFLALEWIEGTSRAANFDDRLGQGLARLHRSSVASFGLAFDNFIGRLPQNNAGVSPDTWAQFYAERRLRPQAKQAVDGRQLPSSFATRIDRLCARLPELVGPAEPPARLHGDLWAGNHVVDEQGQPVLVDPAAYAGHREVDLAMMRLFGGFGPRVFAAYNEAYPMALGHEQRVPLYQLYYLLVHVNLFGTSYVSGVNAALNSLGF